MLGMKAFETQPVRRKGYADGGLVKQLKGMFGMDEEKNARIAEYRRNAAAEKAAAAAQVAQAAAPEQPPPQKAITEYAAGSALKRREAAAGLKDGGPVRGQGTGTSDEVPDEVAEGTYIMPADSTQAIGEQALAGMGKEQVPVNLSNGEFKLPPEQVHAVGVQALDQMKGATHTPAAQQGLGMKPELFFANGGVVDDEQKRLQNQSQAYVIGAQAAAATRAAEPVAKAVAPQIAAPGATAAPPARAAGPSELYMADRTQEMGDQVKAGNYAGAVGTGLRTAAQGLGMYGIEAADKTLSPWIDAGQRMLGGAFGTDTPAGAVKPSAAAPVTPTAPSPATVGAQPGAPAANARPVAQAPASGGALPDPQPAAPQATQIAPGIYRQGNSYSDSAAGAGMTGTQGAPSAQNVQAAQALSDRSQQQALARGMGSVAAPGNAVTVIGADPAAERERRDLVSSFMSPLRGAQNGQLTSSQRNGMVGLLESERRDASGNRQADQTASTQRDIAAMREQGDTGRTAMREQGENSRAGARNQIDTRRVNLDERGQAPKLREADRMDALRARYENAKPEERKALAQQIRELQGNNVQQDVWAHSPGGQAVDPKTQQLITQPGVIYNRATGEVRTDGGAAAPAPARAVGSTSTVNGKTAVWDGNKWVPR